MEAPTVLKNPWYERLSLFVDDDLLTLTDHEGNSLWGHVHARNVEYFARHCTGFQWTSQLALILLVKSLNRNDVHTIRSGLSVLNSRFKALFSHFNLLSASQLIPQKHLYEYVTKQALPQHTDNMRHYFVTWYKIGHHDVERWLRTKCDEKTRSNLEKYLLPRIQFDFRELRLQKKARDNAQEIRKRETDAIVPYFPSIRSEAHLRWNQIRRLRDMYRKLVADVASNKLSLPVEFSYLDRDPHNPKIQLVEEFRFILWDKPSFASAHGEQDRTSTIKSASNKSGEYSEETNEYFLEFVNASPVTNLDSEQIAVEGMWFLPLLATGVLGDWPRTTQGAVNKKLKKQFLLSFGYGDKDEGSNSIPFHGYIKGLINQSSFIINNQDKAAGTIFSVEPIYSAATFGLLAVDLITTTGARVNEVLQIKNTKDCFAVTKITNPHGPPITRYLFRAVPKGRSEPENFFLSNETMKLVHTVTNMLQEYYPDGTIPKVMYRGTRELLSGTAPYLFQYNNTHFERGPLTSCIRLLLHGLLFHDETGSPISIKPHLLRHAFANHAVQAEKLPIDIVGAILHQKDLYVTEYYSQATDSQIATATHELHQIMDAYIDLNSAVVRGPEELRKVFEEAMQKVGVYTQATGGLCSVDAVCPVKMACVGCGAKVPTPEKKNELEYYKRWAETSKSDFETRGLSLEARKMDVAIRNVDKELYEISLIEEYRKDEAYEPEFRINPSE